MKKEKIVSVIILFAMIVSGIFCYFNAVQAANTSDTSYAFNNLNRSGHTEWRGKENSTKVYVHPTSGPASYYIVYGLTKDGEIFEASNRHIISVGTYASITNTVYEDRGAYARLRYDSTTYVNQDTKGVWSPDSTKNYTIYN